MIFYIEQLRTNNITLWVSQSFLFFLTKKEGERMWVEYEIFQTQWNIQKTNSKLCAQLQLQESLNYEAETSNKHDSMFV